MKPTLGGFAECCLGVGTSILRGLAPKDEGTGNVYVLQVDKQRMILNLLVEGNSIRSTERLTGVHRDTIMRLLVRAGERCQMFLDGRMRGIRLNHLQCDEIWTFVRVKQAHIEANRSDDEIGDQYLFVAFDQETKLVPSFTVGKRTTAVTERFMLDLAGRIVHSPAHRPQISTDGFPAYPAAVDLAFANQSRYGLIVKSFKEDKEAPGRYGPPEMTLADRRPLWGIDDPFSICTSHVERNNLSLRTFMKRFTRLSLGFSKKLENLKAAVALHMCYYNFCWRHGALRVTPAMAAKVTNELWGLERLIAEIGM